MKFNGEKVMTAWITRHSSKHYKDFTHWLAEQVECHECKGTDVNKDYHEMGYHQSNCKICRGIGTISRAEVYLE